MRFELIPAIDLRGGRCVRLLRGDPSAETVYGDDPLAQARAFEAAGARTLHVVDLDGAFTGEARNAAAVAAIVRETGLAVEVGGGLRTLDAIDRLLELGAARAILGTVAQRDPVLLETACRRHPGRVWVGIDARGGRVAVEGWAVETATDACALARDVAARGAAGIVYTDIHRDGASTGPNVEETLRVAVAAGVPVIASGGVATSDHVEAVAALAPRGVVGVISGRALYEGTLDLASTLARLAARD